MLACFSEGSHGANQDAVLAKAVGDAVVLAVCDGAGGTSGGASASQFVIEQIAAALESAFDVLDPIPWRRLLEAADRALNERASGETTAVICILDAAGNVAGASVGDSGAWLVDRASGRFVDLAANQQRKPLLGSGRARITPFFHGKKATARDVLLVASDGLFAPCTPAAIVAALRGEAPAEVAGDELLRALANAARLESGALSDDLSIALATRPAG